MAGALRAMTEDARRVFERAAGWPDKVLTIYETDGTRSLVDAADEPVVRRAVADYIANKDANDTLLTLTFLTSGEDYHIPTSCVHSWGVSSQASRVKRDAVDRAELVALRASRLTDFGEDD